MKTSALLLSLLLAPAALGQVTAAERAAFNKVRAQGVEVKLANIAEFRGVVANQIMGIGLVTGLAGTGDSKKFLSTQKAAINVLRLAGVDVDPSQSESKNCALVMLTAELPAYSSPGMRIDVTASTMGDCTDLRGGTLAFAPMKYPGIDKAIATASGAISVGGAGASAGGAKSQRNFTTVGKLPGGAIVQQAVETTTVFNGKMYLDLRQANPTTASRMEDSINKAYPEFHAIAQGAGTIEVDLPTGMNPTTAQARLSGLTVYAEDEARIVINEKDGTIVMGGDVRIGPCAVTQGGLSVRITSEPFVSQPAPRSNGQTVVGSAKTVDVKEETVQTAVFAPNTSVADLAAIFIALRLKADDVINILKGMHEQGALKATLEVH